MGPDASCLDPVGLDHDHPSSLKPQRLVVSVQGLLIPKRAPGLWRERKKPGLLCGPESLSIY